MPFIKLS